MTFEVRARDVTGALRSFSRTASSRDALMDELRAERLLVLSVRETKEARETTFWGLAWLRPMTTFDVELALRQIAALLRSGITLLTAVQTVGDESLSPHARRVWLRVAERIVRGSGFSGALAAEPKRFGELVVRLAEVGERSGELELAIARAADQLEARRSLRAQVVNALAYPFLAVTMAVGVSVFLVVSVIPKVSEFLRAGGADLPALTQFLMDFSNVIRANGPQILAAAAGIVAAWFAVRLNGAGRELEDAFALRVPVTGRILKLSSSALFARSMQIMTESGVTLLDSLGTAARLLANRRLRRRVIESRDSVIRGSSLGEALRPAREFTPMLRRMAAVGETTGALPETFGEAARFHEAELSLAVRRFGMLIEPVMIAVTGIIVGFVYIAFFMAIFAIAGTS